MERRKAKQRNEKRGEKIERRDKRRKKDLSARGRVKREGGEGRYGKTMLRSTVRMILNSLLFGFGGNPKETLC